MKLLEYQAKNIFKKYDIPIPKSDMAKSSNEVKDIAKRFGAVVIKAQLPIGGRGKAGGIKFADNSEEAEKTAEQLLGSRIKNLKITKLLVEEKIDIKDELYLGVTIDRKNRSYVILASSEGGINIEEVVSKDPEKIIQQAIDPLIGLRDYHCRNIAKKLGFSGREMTSLTELIKKLYKVAYEMDAELTEINPLALSCEGFIAVDARLNIDNNSLFRHPELVEIYRKSETEFSKRELKAKKLDLTYVELDGNIGIIGNGAGLTMATLDSVSLLGGKPANFLDLGGGASQENIEKAFTFVLEDTRVKAVFVNILGGITRCDDTARALIETRRQLGSEKPIVVRLMGTNEEEGMKLLIDAKIDTLNTMEEAAKKVVALAVVS